MTTPLDHSADPRIQTLIEQADRTNPDTARAARILELASERRSAMITDGILATWLELWQDGMRPSMVGANIAHQHDLNQLARAALRLDGHLTGPDLRLRPGLLVATGDQLTVTTDHRTGQPDALTKGTLLHVTDVHPARQTITVDIPTLGEHRHITPAGPLARRINHAYATTRSTEHEQNQPGAVRQPAQGVSW